MANHEIIKAFDTDKTVDEIQFNLTFYKSSLEMLVEELNFLKYLMNAPIFKSSTPNIFEKFELYKTRIDVALKTQSKQLNEINKQYKEIGLKIECDEVSCDEFFVKRNYELELDVINFLIQTSQMKLEIMEYLRAIIL